jgi:type VI protein secretion system component VasK
MDNALQGNLKALQDKAKQLIDTQNKQIQSLAAELAKPKAAIQPKATSPAKSLMYQLRARIGS